jgi:hydroxymethylglutaryl-CoA synthase
VDVKNIGIESFGLYTPRYALDLHELARARGVDAAKYTSGLGQDKMAVPPPDEDVVTIGASAAYEALRHVDASKIDTLMFATESGIDQSKAAAIYAHALLGLPRRCKSFEIKQACCGSTAALQMALALVAQKPGRKVLIIASDIARYGLGTPGEPTQGAGAVAMVISDTPTVIAFDTEWGSYTEDVMDFWRPNYRDEALVDGKYSIKIYLKALAESWTQYHEESGRGFHDHDHYCYHLPFTRMADKAHTHLAKINEAPEPTPEQRARHIEASLRYNRVIGNSYTGSLYIGLASLLETTQENLAGHRIGMFSYGSGCMAAYFSGVVLPGYRDALHAERHADMLEDRFPLTMAQYEAFYRHELPKDGARYVTPHHCTGRYRLAGVEQHKRLYETVDAAARNAAQHELVA